MQHDLATEETVVLASFSSWNDAEIAKSYLEDHGIRSVTAGQEPHRAPEFTEGVRLRVLAPNADRALELLEEADLLPVYASDPVEPSSGSMKRQVLWVLAAVAAWIVIAVVFYTR